MGEWLSKMKINTPKIQPLEYDKSEGSQCGPCMVGYPECGGDRKLAKAGKCPKFYNGRFIMEVKRK